MQLESDTIRLLSKTYILSRQQVTDCNPTPNNCISGLPEYALVYIRNAGGVEQESDYPYSTVTYFTGVNGTCKFNPSKAVVTVQDYYNVGGYMTNEQSIAAYVQSVGPVLLLIFPVYLQMYDGGIMTVCPSLYVDHIVQAVGVLPNSQGGYWFVDPNNK